MAMATPGMASGQPSQGEPGTAPGPMPLQGFEGVSGTGGVVPA